MLKSKWIASVLGVLVVASALNAEKLYAGDSPDSAEAPKPDYGFTQSELVKDAFEAVTKSQSRDYVVDRLRTLIRYGLQASEARDRDGNSLISAYLEKSTICDPNPIQLLLRAGVPADPSERVGPTAVDMALLTANKELKQYDWDCSSGGFIQLDSLCTREVTLLMQAGSQFTAGDRLEKTCREGWNGSKTTTTSFLNPGMVSISSSSTSSYSYPQGPSCKIYTVPGSPGVTVCN